jgi:hypothetical protein
MDCTVTVGLLTVAFEAPEETSADFWLPHAARIRHIKRQENFFMVLTPL